MHFSGPPAPGQRKPTAHAERTPADTSNANALEHPVCQTAGMAVGPQPAPERGPEGSTTGPSRAELTLGTAGATRVPVSTADAARANRRWWDADADDYVAEHAGFLGERAFIWCPEGLAEDDAQLLGDVHGARVLELGCGAAACTRWLSDRGARAVGLDLSGQMLRHAADAGGDAGPALVQADAQQLPFADGSFDVTCSAFGAVPFVTDSALLTREVARVLRPGGRWVFAVTHPMRWVFSDDPGPDGLVATTSYFDRTPYVEVDQQGRPVYVEQHRTLGDRVAEIVAAGLVLDGLVEPEWPAGHHREWGQWSPLRGRLFPGTAIFCCRRPGGPP